jgi:FAD binding domain
LHASGILAVFPITPPRFRVIADMGETHAGVAPQGPTMEEVQAIVDERGPGGITASDPIWLTRFTINERKVANYRSGRVFLAGDAAHIHSPAGGQGMNTGMQDAFNLAWKLALVSNGVCAADPLLGSYSAERSPIAEMVLAGAGRLTEMGLMRGDIKQYVRNHIASFLLGLSPLNKKMADVLTEVSVGYPESPLNGKGTHLNGGPKEGQRAPIRGDEPPVGAGATPRFVLFGEADDVGSRMVAQFPALLEPLIRPPFQSGGLWLVRPDGYVALTCEEGDWDRVSDYLSQLAIAGE